MIQQQTILTIADNSGAKTAKCIKVLGGFKRKFAHLGNIIVVSIQDLKNFSNMQKGEIYKALIIRTKKKIKSRDGCASFLFENTVCLIDKKNKRSITPIANRIFGPVSNKLVKKFYDFTKISGETF